MRPLDITDPVQEGYRAILQATDRFCAHRWWQERLWLGCLLLIFWHVAPFFNLHYFNTPNWDAMETQSRALLMPIGASADTHVEKMAFRLFLPSVAALLHIGRTGLFIGQVLAGLVFLRLLIRLSYELLQDKVATVFFALACAACYVCFSGFYDVFGRPDMYPYLFLLLALSRRNPFIIWLACAAAAWCDERGLIHSTLVYLFWVLKEREHPRLRDLMLPNRFAAAVPVAWVTYLAGRFLLSRYAGFQTGFADIGRTVILENSRYFALATFQTFGAAWLVTGLAFYLLFRFRLFAFGWALGAAFGLNWLTSVLVYDINRSLSYSFPVLLISLLLFRHATRPTIRLVLFFAAALSVFLPIGVWDGHYHYLPPLPVRLAEVFLRP